MNARCVHNFDVYPGWHPSEHVPSMWWHCDISLQYPHLVKHLSPNVPSVHSKDIKIIIYYKQLTLKPINIITITLNIISRSSSAMQKHHILF